MRQIQERESTYGHSSVITDTQRANVDGVNCTQSHRQNVHRHGTFRRAMATIGFRRITFCVYDLFR